MGRGAARRIPSRADLPDGNHHVAVSVTAEPLEALA